MTDYTRGPADPDLQDDQRIYYSPGARPDSPDPHYEPDPRYAPDPRDGRRRADAYMPPGYAGGQDAPRRDGRGRPDGHSRTGGRVRGSDGGGAGGAGPRRGSPRPRRRGPRGPRRTWLRALGIVVGVLVLLVLIAGFWLNRQINPGGKHGPAVTVVIPKGSSKSDIGKLLAKAGVIHDGSLFPYYASLRGGTLYPGTYHLDKNSSYGSVLAALHSGPQIVVRSLVIPEGYTVAQIANAVGALPGIGISAKQFLAAADSGTVRSPYEPAGSHNLEGLLFPATYQVTQGESPTALIRHMVDAFDARADQIGLTAAASRLGYSPYQLVTVASIVERESKVTSDRAPVASTIYNRLRVGMPLGADSTQTYYLRLTDPTIEPTPDQLDQPSPYNTRLNKGLPPTPIADPGLPSLEAAANPSNTNYLYFVEVNPDGKLAFASDNAGFESLQQQCRTAGLC